MNTPTFLTDPGKLEPVADLTLLNAATRFLVKLRDNPAVEIDADSPFDAIEKYKTLNGILSTVHQFAVSPVD